MGRHSAPEDDDDPQDAGVARGDAPVNSGLALLDAVPDEEDEPRGRHAVRSPAAATPTAVLDRPDGPAAETAGIVPPATEVFASPGPAAEPVPAVDPAAIAEPSSAVERQPHGTKADLALLRSSPGLRARAAAAVVVPILVYAVVLAVIGQFGEFVYWVWIPIVVAGVLFGLMLDLAERARRGGDATAADGTAPGADGGDEPPGPPAAS